MKHGTRQYCKSCKRQTRSLKEWFSTLCSKWREAEETLAGSLLPMLTNLEGLVLEAASDESSREPPHTAEGDVKHSWATYMPHWPCYRKLTTFDWDGGLTQDIAAFLSRGREGLDAGFSMITNTTRAGENPGGQVMVEASRKMINFVCSLDDSNLSGATAIKADGEGIEVLFDMMAHTLDGSSGVGDHGKSGIETFLQKHECGNRCRYLRLSCDGFAHSLDSTDEEETE
ncbi:hypothetical protein B0H14DRAFT_2581143 [Mycena olivaceomarginata]|nr:hypothetical protein B0H14DRAFT_2581143 [Mycena olivaceomarginata]